MVDIDEAGGHFFDTWEELDLFSEGGAISKSDRLLGDSISEIIDTPKISSRFGDLQANRRSDQG